MDYGAPLTPEPLDTRALAKLIGFKPDPGARVVLTEERTFWCVGGLWYDYAEKPDGSS